MVTNKHNLPQALVNLLGAREYSKGRSHWSVTQLIGSPRITVLRNQFKKDITETEDLSDRFWSLMGSNIHKILEHAVTDNSVVEERIFLEAQGVTVSGQIDVQEHGDGVVDLIDWKFTNVYAVSHPKPEWESQLNLYAYLVQKVKGVKVEKASVCAIIRDWRKTDSLRRFPYPAAPIVMIDIPLWSFTMQEKFFEERLTTLLNAYTLNSLGEELPECSDEDRWLRNGAYIRCQHYCDVAPYCSQWRNHEHKEPEGGDAPPAKSRSKRVPAAAGKAPRNARKRRSGGGDDDLGGEPK
jgi:hypothetical protein